MILYSALCMPLGSPSNGIASDAINSEIIMRPFGMPVSCIVARTVVYLVTILFSPFFWSIHLVES